MASITGRDALALDSEGAMGDGVRLRDKARSSWQNKDEQGKHNTAEQITKLKVTFSFNH